MSGRRAVAGLAVRFVAVAAVAFAVATTVLGCALLTIREDRS